MVGNGLLLSYNKNGKGSKGKDVKSSDVLFMSVSLKEDSDTEDSVSHKEHPEQHTKTRKYTHISHHASLPKHFSCDNTFWLLCPLRDRQTYR